MKTSLVVAGLALSLVTACSRSETWSCNNPGRHACSEWSTAGTDAATTAKQQASCGQMGGTVAQGPCTDASSIGSCVSSGGGASSRMVYYAPRAVPDAQQSCAALGGTWKAAQ